MNDKANQVNKQGMELGSRLITDVLSWVHQKVWKFSKKQVTEMCPDIKLDW